MKYLLIALLPLLSVSCAFKSPFVAAATADGKYWIVEKPLIYHYEERNVTIEVPKGFVTDLASVPRAFWGALPPCANYTPAAVVHDYLYWVQDDRISKDEADRILLEAMTSSRVKLLSRQAVFRSVQAFGKGAWARNGELNKIENRLLTETEVKNVDFTKDWKDIHSTVSKPVPDVKLRANVRPGI